LPALVDQEFGVSRVFNTKRNQVVQRNAGFHEIGVLCVDNVELENIFIEFLLGVNFINVLRGRFFLYKSAFVLLPKPKRNQRKATKKTFEQKTRALNRSMKLTAGVRKYFPITNVGNFNREIGGYLMLS
jgi:hypothetical protein